MNKNVFKVTILYILFLLCFFVIDYFNILNSISANFNYNFLGVIISASTTIYLFCVTYYLIDKKISDNESEKKINKQNALYIMLSETYSLCKESIDLYANNELLMKYAIKKVDFDQVNNPFIEQQKAYPFRYDNKILELVSDGVVDNKILKQYIEIKKSFNAYINSKTMLLAMEVKKGVKHDNIRDLKETISDIENSLCANLDRVINEINKNVKEIK